MSELQQVRVEVHEGMDAHTEESLFGMFNKIIYSDLLRLSCKLLMEFKLSKSKLIKCSVEYYENDDNKSKNKLKRIEWYCNDDLQSMNDNPAVIDYYRDEDEENVWMIEYYNEGYKDRKSGPAVVEYNKEGVVLVYEYWKEGNMSREDGPALIEYDDNGKKKVEQWWLNGELLDELIYDSD